MHFAGPKSIHCRNAMQCDTPTARSTPAWATPQEQNRNPNEAESLNHRSRGHRPRNYITIIPRPVRAGQSSPVVLPPDFLADLFDFFADLLCVEEPFRFHGSILLLWVGQMRSKACSSADTVSAPLAAIVSTNRI